MNIQNPFPRSYEEEEAPPLGPMLLFVLIGILWVAVTSPYWLPLWLSFKIRQLLGRV